MMLVEDQDVLTAHSPDSKKEDSLETDSIPNQILALSVCEGVCAWLMSVVCLWGVIDFAPLLFFEIGLLFFACRT